MLKKKMKLNKQSKSKNEQVYTLKFDVSIPTCEVQPFNVKDFFKAAYTYNIVEKKDN